MNSTEVRNNFLSYFEEKGHKIVSSAPIVLKHDPSLMFTNAGMNQFKDFFLGDKKAEARRVTNSQKCLRVSGKHNDLEEVGKDTYHHTMFEMLGNWSFGDYFKKEAIEMAWELLTGVYGINAENLYVTYFEGSSEDNLPPDEEARENWQKYVPEERILTGNKKDNFWEMGDTGPCGPCSEIHIDLRSAEEKKKTPGANLVNKDHPQVIEIWNLVFIQFNRLSDGHLQNLPEKHVDTGMGFERLCMVLQGKTSNYDTDLFEPLIQKIEQVSGLKYGKSEKTDMAFRVVADHIRAISFTIADGQAPSNTGAGYVIRRILRRAVRYGYSFLQIDQPFLHELVDELSLLYKDVFSEIHRQQDFLKKLIHDEEQSFRRTLETGLRRFEEYVQTLDTKTKIIDGKFAFELYDTYGFPPDLTALLGEEKGLAFDKTGFEKEMKQQKDRSRAAAKKETGDWVEVSNGAEVKFTGYDNWQTQSRVLKYRAVKQKDKAFYHLVLNQTPFYAESGGQVGDTGMLTTENGENIPVIDTQKENELIVHLVKKLPENLNTTFHAKIDAEKRLKTQANHSATHLLHAALKQVLGNHVEQKGSLVNSEYLRFDFSHSGKMTDEEISKVEAIVNEKIRQNILLTEERDIPFKEAVQKGAMALFGEKYGEKVRIITFDRDFSVELCGGTHVPSTGHIGFFKITQETAISAGVRRIEAMTGKAAEDFVRKHIDELKAVKFLLKNPKEAVKSIEQLLAENNSLKKEIEKLKKEKAGDLKGDLQAKFSEEGGLLWFHEILEDTDANQVKDIAFQFRQQFDNLIFIAGIISNDKPQLNIMIADALVKKHGLNAGQIVREAAKEMQGGGGGQPFFATAGGKYPQGLKAAIEKAVELIKNGI